MRTLHAITLMGLSLLSPRLLAESSVSETLTENPRYFFVNGVYVDTDSGRDVRNGTGFQGGFSIPFGNSWGVEVNGFSHTFETGSAGGTDFYHRGGGADLVYSPGHRSRFTPFILAGLGAAYNDVTPNSRDRTTGYGNIGIGLVGGLLGDWLRGRVEARAVYDTFEKGQVDYVFGGGLEFAVGVTRERVVQNEVEKTVYVDKPVEKTVYVEKVVEQVVEKPVEVERVVEKVVEKVVDRVVAPPDSDGDNIADDKDQCPGTLPGLVTNNRGCVIGQQVVRLDNVFFEYNSAVLTSASVALLDNAALFLRQQPDMQVEIAGHTDSRGSDAYNQTLSQRRAESVVAALVARQVSAARLTARGYGESQPMSDNVTDEGRARNRRVELRTKDSGVPR